MAIFSNERRLVEIKDQTSCAKIFFSRPPCKGVPVVVVESAAFQLDTRSGPELT